MGPLRSRTYSRAEAEDWKRDELGEQFHTYVMSEDEKRSNIREFGKTAIRYGWHLEKRE
jgi:hypothetical protein